MAALFPMFVKLAGRKCVIVGGGKVAESKIEALLLSGAEVYVVAPEASRQGANLASEGKLRWKQKSFRPSDLKGIALVIAATDFRDVNEMVFRVAERLGILCNSVDQPDQCHFYYPAVVRRGALQIAISTSGLSPSLAHRLRVELEAQFGPEYEAYLEWLNAVRRTVFSKHADRTRRQRLLERFAGRTMQSTFEAHRQSRREQR